MTWTCKKNFSASTTTFYYASESLVPQFSGTVIEWYAVVYVNLYSAIVAKVSNALCTLVLREAKYSADIVISWLMLLQICHLSSWTIFIIVSDLWCFYRINHCFCRIYCKFSLQPNPCHYEAVSVSVLMPDALHIDVLLTDDWGELAKLLLEHL